VRREPSLRVLILAATTGILGAFSFTRFSCYFLIWLTFFPLLVAIDGKRLGTRLVLGLVTGLVGFFGAFHWIWGSAGRFLGLGPGTAALLFFLFLCWHSFQLGLFTALLRTSSTGVVAALAPPLLWVPLEWFFDVKPVLALSATARSFPPGPACRDPA
jgi:apolipoprotein N-acyltransferase